MEFKIITPKEWLTMFKHNLTENQINEFIRTTKTTKIVRLKGTKNFRPVYSNSVGAYILKGNKEVYIR